MRVFEAFYWDAPSIPWKAQRILLAERFNWTLDYVDGLGMREIIQINVVLDAKARAQTGRLEAFG